MAMNRAEALELREWLLREGTLPSA